MSTPSDGMVEPSADAQERSSRRSVGDGASVGIPPLTPDSPQWDTLSFYDATTHSSGAWNYFGVLPSPDASSSRQTLAVCLFCGAVLVASSGSTSSLLRHLTSHNSDAAYGRINRCLAQRFKLAASSNHDTELLPLTPSQRQSFVRLVVAGEHELSMGEQPEFQSFLRSLGYSSAGLSRRSVTRLVTDAYKTFVSSKPLDDALAVNLAVDCWSGHSRGSVFVSVSARYVTPSLQLATKMLALPSCPTGGHDNLIIRDAIQSTMSAFSLTNSRIVSMVTDNGSDMLKAAREHFPFPNINCISHTFDLLVDDVVRGSPSLIASLVTLVSSTVNDIRRAPKLCAELRRLALSAEGKSSIVTRKASLDALVNCEPSNAADESEDDGDASSGPWPTGLLAPNETRWLGVFQMLERVFVMFDVLLRLANTSVTIWNMFPLKPLEHHIKAAVVCLQPAYDITKLLQHRHTTLGMAMYWIGRFRNRLSPTDDEAVGGQFDQSLIPAGESIAQARDAAQQASAALEELTDVELQVLGHSTSAAAGAAAPPAGGAEPASAAAAQSAQPVAVSLTPAQQLAQSLINSLSKKDHLRFIQNRVEAAEKMRAQAEARAALMMSIDLFKCTASDLAINTRKFFRERLDARFFNEATSHYRQEFATPVLGAKNLLQLSVLCMALDVRVYMCGLNHLWEQSWFKALAPPVRNQGLPWPTFVSNCIELSAKSFYSERARQTLAGAGAGAGAAASAAVSASAAAAAAAAAADTASAAADALTSPRSEEQQTQPRKRHARKESETERLFARLMSPDQLESRRPLGRFDARKDDTAERARTEWRAAERELQDERKDWDSKRMPDPLVFWAHKKDKFPAVASLAASVLSLPASGAEVERCNSTSGRILTPFRARLSADHLEALTVLAHNWRMERTEE